MAQAAKKLSTLPSIGTADLSGMKMPEPSETLKESMRKLNDERDVLEALRADYSETEALLSKQISDMAKWQRDEVEYTRKLALDPDNKRMRDFIDELRGKQSVTREVIDSNEKINLSRKEMIEETKQHIRQLETLVKSGRMAFKDSVYRANEAELIADVRAALTKLFAYRFLASMNLHIEKAVPRDTYADDVQDLHAQLVAEVESAINGT